MYFSYKIHFETEQSTKYKLHAMYLITYFKYLHFNYLTTLQTNTQNNLGFSHALPAAHAKLCMVRQPKNVICCKLPGGGGSAVRPRNPPPGALPLDPGGGLPSARPSMPPTSKSWLRHCATLIVASFPPSSPMRDAILTCARKPT